MDGIEHNARFEEWQFFVTLTFRDPVPGETGRTKMLFAWLRSICERPVRGGHLDGLHFHRLIWLARSERGEATGRLHFHCLVNGLPAERVNVVEAYRQQWLWEKLGGGIARIRMYDSRLDGVSYTLKGLGEASRAGANDYELSKFTDAAGAILIVSQAALGKWCGSVRRGGGSRAHGIPKSRKRDTTAARGTRRELQKVITGFSYPKE